jgi:hypothetical protein
MGWPNAHGSRTRPARGSLVGINGVRRKPRNAGMTKNVPANSKKHLRNTGGVGLAPSPLFLVLTGEREKGGGVLSRTV